MLNGKQGSYIMLNGTRVDSDPRVHHPKYVSTMTS
jgi:hypothetical protein